MPYTDDKTIPGDERLLRRIHPDWQVADHTRQVWRPSTAAFSDSKDGSPVSVSLQSVLILNGLAVTHPLQGFDENYCLAAVTALFARSLGLEVQRDSEPRDPSHSLLFGKKTESVRRKLATNSEWVVAPAMPLPDEMLSVAHNFESFFR